jgi:hypothetical protein
MTTVSSLALPLHLGSLHAYETVLLAVLAFGPFVVLAVVVFVLRRRDIAAEEAEHSADAHERPQA